MLSWLYGSALGRIILKILTAPAISKLAGAFLDSKVSTLLIPLFIRSNNIDLSDVKTETWQSFNQFFTRELVDGARTVDMDEEAFISPCDAFLKVYPIEEGAIYPVKESEYTAAELLKSHKLAKLYEGGSCLIFRLTPAHYHRYIYPQSGEKSQTYGIKGVLHTVQPVATRATKVYAQNSRAFSIIKSKNFGPLVFMQVGALLVGRIVNNDPQKKEVIRGEEAGRFEFGGSTIIVLVRKNQVDIDKAILQASAAGEETPVKLGQKIGSKHA